MLNITASARAVRIITKGIAPCIKGNDYARIPSRWSAQQVETWKLVTNAVHAKKGSIFAQLMHTGRVSHSANMAKGARILAPCALAFAGQMYTDQIAMQD